MTLQNIEEAFTIVTRLEVYSQANTDAPNERKVWALSAKNDLKRTIKKVQEDNHKLVEDIKGE